MGVPLIAVVSCVAIVVLKRRRKKEQLRADDEARRQNEQNVVHCISKKMDKMEQFRIVNALDFPKIKCINDDVKDVYGVVTTSGPNPSTSTPARKRSRPVATPLTSR